MVIGLIAIFVIIILIDIPGILKTNKKIKTMVIYFFLMAAGFVISLLLIIDKAPTSPSKIIERIVKSVFMR